MKLSEIYNKSQNKGPVFSIEIFPPKEESHNEALFDELQIIKETVNPSLVSVTYGAGGSNREKSNVIVKELLKRFDFKAVMPHFTCVCSSKSFIEEYLKEIEALGIENILALKGDEPKEISVCYRDFRWASELVEFIKSNTELEIAVAGYPEGHIAAKSFEDDIQNLKRKITRGGSLVFTQLFFENGNFYKYLETVRKESINIPIIAGILPVVSYQGLMRMVELSGVKLPLKAKNLFEKYQNSKEDTQKAGVEWATSQVEDLIKNGVDGIHFYTLNKAKSTVEILKNLGC